MTSSAPLGAVDSHLSSQHMKGLSHLSNGQTNPGKEPVGKARGASSRPSQWSPQIILQKANTPASGEHWSRGAGTKETQDKLHYRMLLICATIWWVVMMTPIFHMEKWTPRGWIICSGELIRGKVRIWTRVFNRGLAYFSFPQPPHWVWWPQS